MASGLLSSLENLGSDIEDLEESLTPILNAALSASTSKLPLLDKAKLYVLATYAIESLLFSFIRLNGVEAKSHPVFRELARVKQYFDKIKTAESAGLKPNAKLDKDAAGRFVKHALAGNDEYDRKREQQLQKERAGAKRKFEDMTERVGSHTRFEAMGKKLKADEEKQAALGQGDEHEDDGHRSAQKADASLTKEERRERRRDEKNARRAERRHTKFEEEDATGQDTEESQAASVVARKQKSHIPPRGHREAFEGLLKGPLPEREDHGGKKKKRKSRHEMRQKAEDERADEMK